MRVAVGDVRLFVEVFGQEWVFTGSRMERRPVLIGLHGGPGLDGSKLRYQLAPLAEIAQLVVPDLRGHGRSDRGSKERWTLETWAADVKGLADALDIQRPVVLGFSFGGDVALRYASSFPDHPGGLIVVSSSARLPTSQETIERFREVGGDEAAEVHRRDLEAPSEETAAEWGRVCFPLLSRRTEPDPLLKQLEAWRFENQSLEVNLHYAEEARTTDLLPGLGAVRCPTLVLIGEHDPLILIREAEAIVEAIPAPLARLERVPEAAHDVFTDNAEYVYSRIRSFLRELSRAEDAGTAAERARTARRKPAIEHRAASWLKALGARTGSAVSRHPDQSMSAQRVNHEAAQKRVLAGPKGHDCRDLNFGHFRQNSR